MEQELLDRKATATFLGGISLRTLDNLVENGELKPVRIGKRVFFRRKHLLRFTQRDHRTRQAKSELDNHAA